MKNLKKAQIKLVSGGFTNIDSDTYKKMQKKALLDGLIYAGIASFLLGIPMWGAQGSVAGVVSAISVAPYAGIYGYLKSAPEF